MNRPACVKWITVSAWLAVTACTPLSYPGQPLSEPRPMPTRELASALDQLRSDLAPAAPDAEILTPLPGSDACGRNGTSIIRGAFPEHVLFATANDQPAPSAAGIVTLLADRIRHDAPQAELTVLGHTDSVGSEAYNMDLSKRRALSVMRGLAAAGLDPNRLSAVAIGKRQPIADNGTADGRARNRRVEFIISGCLSANLGVVRAQASSAADAGSAVEVMRLDPSAAYGLATVGTVLLRQLVADEPVRAAVAPAVAGPRPALLPPAGVARPAPAPHYQPKTLSPDAQPSPLGPAVPF